ncbi:hypothetical protein BCR36DRAFT_366272 [Piromyces finnis]|uniref:Uncharacterized protein n=1 Tax=Piromyces finnis TaxID=1754191 RepID=A0A1Y1VKS8_9FUNG|nr:hypothetical protein BCR36DRAFT_366272 [Piromyces finnis]|eukprot:ORX59087.1 hypothetical protein BCR36DRAFT_366272 [Piromyces finnis]
MKYFLVLFKNFCFYVNNPIYRKILNIKIPYDYKEEDYKRHMEEKKKNKKIEKEKKKTEKRKKYKKYNSNNNYSYSYNNDYDSYDDYYDSFDEYNYQNNDEYLYLDPGNCFDSENEIDKAWFNYND